MPAPLCAKLRLACKCIELCLAIVCIGLYVNAPMHSTKESTMTPSGTLLTITFGGYVIILSGVILGYISCEKVPKKIDLLFTLVGMCLFIAAGSVAINYYNHHPDPHTSKMMTHSRIGLACGAISIINGVVFLLDTMLSYKDVSENYTPH